MGIAPEFLPHVFECFSQANSPSAPRNSGLGLGLTIVRHLVELHGGTVSVESQGSGKGSIFTVMLPLATGTTTKASSEPQAPGFITRAATL
jgi:signal transduction histidine kinase